MGNYQIAELYPRIKSLLEEKYGIIKSTFVRGNLEEDNPQEVSEKELSLLSAGEDVWIQFFLCIFDIRTISSGKRIAPECFNRCGTPNEEEDEEYEDLENFDDEDNLYPDLILIRLKLGADGITMFAKLHVYPADGYKFIVYPDLKESVATYLKEIDVENFWHLQLDENGSLFVLGKKHLQECSSNGARKEIIDYFLAKDGFRNNIYTLYDCLRIGIRNIEKVWREPWLPACEPDDLLIDEDKVEVYRKAWSLMSECVMGETADKYGILFMTTNKVLGFKPARRIMLSGTIETGSMKRGMMVCFPLSELLPLTITSIKKDGEAVKCAKEGDTVVVTLLDEEDEEDDYYDALSISSYSLSCLLAYDEQLKFDHKKLADMMNEVHYRPKHAAAVSTKMIRRKELLNGGTSGILNFVAESIGLPDDKEE